MGEVSQKVIFTSNETEVEKDELEVKAIGLQGHLEITPKVERLEFKKSDVYNILSSTRTLNLKNDGNKKVVIKSIKTSSGFTTDWTTNTILPQEKKALKITFNPKNLVNYSGSLTIITDVQEAPIYIGLSGEVIYISGLDNNKKQTLEKISLYPNPSRDGFTLKIEDPITGKLQVKIFDIKGTQIQNFQFSKNQKTFSKRLDMSTELPSGVYHIIVYLPGKIAHINWYAGPEHRNY